MPARPSIWASCTGRSGSFRRPSLRFVARSRTSRSTPPPLTAWPTRWSSRGSADEGKAAMARFQKLSESSYAITYSQTYLEQGRYAEAITSTGAEAPLVDTRVPDVTFVGCDDDDASAAWPPLRAAAGSVALVDLDGDGDLDLLEAGAGVSRVYRNDGGRFADVDGRTARRRQRQPATGGSPATTTTTAGRPDGPRAVRRSLLQSRRPSGFSDVTTAAELRPMQAPRSAAWLDADHDGDLDLVVASGPARHRRRTRLLRNNGNGRFTDVTKEPGIDVAAAGCRGRPDGLRQSPRYRPAGRVGNGLAAALSQSSRRHVPGRRRRRWPRARPRRGDGRDRRRQQGRLPGFLLSARRTPPASSRRAMAVAALSTAPAPAGTADARAAQFIDYDNDGLLDLFLLTGGTAAASESRPRLDRTSPRGP